MREYNGILLTKENIDLLFTKEQITDEMMYQFVGRVLDNEFIKYFSQDVYNIIDNQIIKNKYFLQLDIVIETMGVAKFYELYQKLFRNAQPFNDNFDIYFFIKVIEYLSNNISLMKSLKNNSLDDNNINNLLMAINNDDFLNDIGDLLIYQETYKKKIIESDLSIKDKICYLLLNTDYVGSKMFIENILNMDNAIYLQLEFSNDKDKYDYLEKCINFIGIINSLESISDQNILNNILINIVSKYDMRNLTNYYLLENNIRFLYKELYLRKQVDLDELKNNNRCENINGVSVYHLEGLEFNIFTHNEDVSDVFADSFEENHYQRPGMPKYANYICMELVNQYKFDSFGKSGNYGFYFDRSYDLIAFGNHDVYINHVPYKKPLFKVNNSFTNPIDISFFYKSGWYCDNEFDFLRENMHNKSIQSSYPLYDNYDKVIDRTKWSKEPILYLDKEKHKNLLYQKFMNYIDNIEILNYKEIYKLIAMTKIDHNRFILNDETLNQIIDRISNLQEREKYLLYNVLNKYSINYQNILDLNNNHKK